MGNSRVGSVASFHQERHPVLNGWFRPLMLTPAYKYYRQWCRERGKEAIERSLFKQKFRALDAKVIAKQRAETKRGIRLLRSRQPDPRQSRSSTPLPKEFAPNLRPMLPTYSAVAVAAR